MGASGGGRLALLAAYTAKYPTFQPDDVTVDTPVRAVVSMYGITDLVTFPHEDGRANPGQPAFSTQITAALRPRVYDANMLGRLLTDVWEFAWRTAAAGQVVGRHATRCRTSIGLLHRWHTLDRTVPRLADIRRERFCRLCITWATVCLRRRDRWVRSRSMLGSRILCTASTHPSGYHSAFLRPPRSPPHDSERFRAAMVEG